jgi:CRISPR/Cas system CSM-associated protein Csm2 small subunit
MHPKIALDLLPQTLSKAIRTAEFAAFLETHVDYLTCSDKENVLYSELNNIVDSIKAYVRVYNSYHSRHASC